MSEATIWILGEGRFEGDAVLDVIQPGLEWERGGERRAVPRAAFYAWMSELARGVVARYAELPEVKEHELEWLLTAALLIRSAADAHTSPELQHQLLYTHGLIQPLTVFAGASVVPARQATALLLDLYRWATKRTLKVRRYPQTCAELAARVRLWHGAWADYQGQDPEQAQAEARRAQLTAWAVAVAEVGSP